MNPNPTQAPQSQPLNQALVQQLPSGVPPSTQAQPVTELALQPQSTDHQIQQPLNPEVRHSPPVVQTNPLANIMSRVIGGSQPATCAKSLIDVIDLDDEDDTPLECANVRTANQHTVANTTINVHIGTTGTTVSTPAAQESIQYSTPVKIIVEPQIQKIPEQLPNIREPIAIPESTPVFTLPKIDNKQSLPSNSMGIGQEITNLHQIQTPTFRHGNNTPNENAMINQMAAVTVEQPVIPVSKPSSPIINAISAPTIVQEIKHTRNEILIEDIQSSIAINIDNQTNVCHPQQPKPHEEPSKPVYQQQIDKYSNVENPNIIVEQPLSHQIQHQNQVFHHTENQQFVPSAEQNQSVHTGHHQQDKQQQQQAPHCVDHHQIPQITVHIPLHSIPQIQPQQQQTVQNQHEHQVVLPQALPQHNLEHHHHMQQLAVPIVHVHPIATVQIVEPPAVIALPYYQQISVKVSIMQEQPGHNQPQTEQHEQVMSQAQPQAEVGITVQLAQTIPQNLGQSINDHVETTQINNHAHPEQEVHQSQQQQQVQIQIQQQQQFHQQRQQEEQQLQQQPQLQILQQIQAPIQQQQQQQLQQQPQQQPAEISSPIEFAISAQSPELTDINQIRKMLLKYLPPHLKQLTQTLADDQLRDMYLEIRAEEMRVAAAQASVIAEQQSLPSKQKQKQKKDEPSKKSSQNKLTHESKKKDSPKKQRENLSKKAMPTPVATPTTNHIHQQSKSNTTTPPQHSNNHKSTTATAVQNRKSRRQRKRVVTTVVQQVEYYDDSDGETPSKTMMMENGQVIKKKKPTNKTQMHSILNQLCTLVRSLDLTALGANNGSVSSESNGV